MSIKIENTQVFGWEAAIRGMRNPMESWDRIDSDYLDAKFYAGAAIYEELFALGENDHDLMMKLAKAGSVEAKYRRMITVSVDICAPLYWWKEFDTYKVGTVANSCSTMHRIHAKEFTLDDFSWDQLLNTGCNLFAEEKDKGLFTRNVQPLNLLTDYIISSLNVCREKFLETKDKKYWWQMIQLLPSSYNQKRTVMMNYEVLANIYKNRKEHKLDEWREYCEWIKSLPYSELITMEENNDDPV